MASLVVLAGPSPTSTDFIIPADSVKNCNLFIDNPGRVLVNVNSKSTIITELKNGIVYIDGKGFLNLLTGKVYRLQDSIERAHLAKALGDSILAIRNSREQVVVNLKTNYSYYKKKWSTRIFNTQPVIESYNSSIIPIFQNDSTVLITSIRDNRILLKLSGAGKFNSKTFIADNHLLLANRDFCYKISMDGAIILQIPLVQGIYSDVLLVNKQLIFWNKESGLEAYREDGVLAWRYPANISTYINLIRQENTVYFNDGNVKCLDLESGNILWSRTEEPQAIDNNNLTVTGKYIITALYHDSDASIVLIDKSNGKLICDGYSMENEFGLDRYVFFRFFKNNTFFAKDAGGYGYDILKISLKK